MTDKQKKEKRNNKVELASSPCAINDVDPDYMGLACPETQEEKKAPAKNPLTRASKKRKQN